MIRRSSLRISNAILILLAASGLSLPDYARSAQKTAPVPNDPLEIVTSRIKTADNPSRRSAAVDLLGRARNSYALRSSVHAYDLKVTFEVNSGGQTSFDGAWEMEDIYDPQQGLRWTAKNGTAYSTTQIATSDMFYGQGTADYIPLRLQEARAALFDPIPTAAHVGRAAIRTSKAFFNGAQITCILLSRSGIAAAATPGRHWEETVECIDPKSGLLQMHSQIPGRYYSYDYTNASQFAGRTLPRKVTVTEAGKVVSEITVRSIEELPGVDPSLFVPTEEMKTRGQSVAMAGAQKITRVIGRSPVDPGATIHPVCVFGLVTAAGELVEAHSLQPSDPNSQAAVEAAKQINFSNPTPIVSRPQQHFVFIIEKFVSSQ